MVKTVVEIEVEQKVVYCVWLKIMVQFDIMVQLPKRTFHNINNYRQFALLLPFLDKEK